MYKVKFRWYGANGAAHYKAIELPKGARPCLGLDKNGVEVYAGDTVRDAFGNEFPADIILMPIEKLERI